MNPNSKNSFLVIDVGEYGVHVAVCHEVQGKPLLESPMTHAYTAFSLKERLQEIVEFASTFHVSRTAWTFVPSVLLSRVLMQSAERKEENTLIQGREKNELEKSILAQAEEKGKQQVSQKTGILPEDLVGVRTMVLEQRVDGYAIPSIERMKGKRIEFRLLLSFLEQRVLNSLANSLSFSTMGVEFIGGEAHALDRVYRVAVPSLADTLFIDIGELTTRFFLFSDGSLSLLGEFQRGAENFTKAIEQALHLSRQEAIALKEKYAAKERLEKNESSALKELFLEESKLWYQALEKTLSELGGAFVPSTFLFGGGSMLEEIQEFCEDECKILLPQDILPCAPSFSSSPRFTSLALLASETAQLFS